MDSELEDLKKKRMDELKPKSSEARRGPVAIPPGGMRNRLLPICDTSRLGQAYAEQLQKQSSKRQQAEAEMARQLEAIEGAVKAHLTKEALQRYGTLKLAHPETATQLIMAVAHAIDAGKLRGMLGDEQLKEALQQLSRLSHKGKETKITRI